jgi:CRISPR type III-A-associated protein Csm2
MSERRFVNPQSAKNPQNQGSQQGSREGERLRPVLEGKAEAIVEQAEALAKEIEKLPATQLRNFYTPLIQLRESQDDLPTKLHKLVLHRPRLAYMKAREGRAEPLQRAFDWLIREVGKQKDPKQLEHLFEFAEAIVAYHKAKKTERE